MTARMELRPMERWDLPPTAERMSSGRFRVTWKTIRDHLLNECGLLGAGLVVVELVVDPDGVRKDGGIRANARVFHPGVKVSFTSEHGPLAYATDAYEKQWSGALPGWQANLRAIGLGLESLRAVDRYGITRSGEQYRGWTAIAAQPAEKTLTADEAVQLLSPYWTGPSADLRRSETAVKAAFRDAARTHHPDAGGNADAFRLISAARDLLMSTL